MQRSIQITVLDNTYELEIPTNGQLIDIESMKMMMSKGMYRSLVANGQTISSSTALDTIDMIAMFSICIPQLTTDLNVKSMMDLDILDTQQLLKVYREQVAPWIVEWQKLLAAYLDSE